MNVADDAVALAGSARPKSTGTTVANSDVEVEMHFLLRPSVPLPTLDALPAALHAGLDPACFDASDADLQMVESYLSGVGLRILSSDKRQRLMTVGGNIGQIRDIFKVDLDLITNGTRSFLSHSLPIRLPQAIHDRILWVFGLETSACALACSRNYRSSPERNTLMDAKVEAVAPITRPPVPKLTSYSVPKLAEIYDFPSGDGTGQCVGIIALSGGFVQSDLDAYFQSLGSGTPSIAAWKENQNSDPISNYQVEQNIEVVGAVLPKAKIALYNCNSTSLGIADFYLTFSKAIFDEENRPEVLINPWVFLENQWPNILAGFGVTASEVAMFEALFTIAALRRITICSAAGSNGALTPIAILYPTDGSILNGIALPNTYYPPSSPLHLGIGGSTLYLDKNQQPLDTVYNRLQYPMLVNGVPYNCGATGGGVSELCTLPAYQQDAKVPVGGSFYWDNGAFGLSEERLGRGVPDVSIVADTFTGYQIYFEGQWGVGGGTGLSVTLWGVLMALLNAQVGQRLGWVNPELYELQITQKAGAFRTVTGGNNGAFDAPLGQEWNACCGLGVPIGSKLASELTGLLSKRTSVSPPNA